MVSSIQELAEIGSDGVRCGVESGLGGDGQVDALREALTQQPVGVLVRSAVLTALAATAHADGWG